MTSPLLSEALELARQLTEEDVVTAPLVSWVDRALLLSDALLALAAERQAEDAVIEAAEAWASAAGPRAWSGTLDIMLHEAVDALRQQRSAIASHSTETGEE